MGVARVLVLPVYRRYWLYHAWTDTSKAEQAAPQTLVGRLQTKALETFRQQWNKIEAAPAGTFNNRLYRLAQYLMSRVDPSETFLKALPQQADALEIRYPSSLPERLVRRRLRLLAAKAIPFHRSRLRIWSMAILPQLPLIPLPLPNVTIYYTVWRVVSNFSAERGASSLAAALELCSDMQRLKLAQQLQQLQQESGLQLKPGSWTQQLVADISRLATPLPLSAVQALMESYKQPHLLEHYKAANRKCLKPEQQQQTE
eukprot:gene3909-4163_t